MRWRAALEAENVGLAQEAACARWRAGRGSARPTTGAFNRELSRHDRGHLFPAFTASTMSQTSTHRLSADTPQPRPAPAAENGAAFDGGAGRWPSAAVIVFLVLAQLAWFLLPGWLLAWWQCGEAGRALVVSLGTPACWGLNLLAWTIWMLLVWALLCRHLPRCQDDGFAAADEEQRP